MVVVGRRGEHSYVANAVRHEDEAVLARADARDVAECLAQTADFHAQPRAVRFICMSGAKSACKQRFAGRIAWPCFGQRTREREQHRPCLKRNRFARKAYSVTAGIDDERLRGKQGLDLVEPQRLFTAARNRTVRQVS